MALTWTVNFDWTTAGTFDTSRNDALNMVDYRLTRGRRDFINGSGNGLEAVEPGMLQITLDNRDGVYDPYNTSSVLYPKVEPGRFVRVYVGDDTLVDHNNIKVLLHGNGVDGGGVVDESGKAWSGTVTTDYYKFGGACISSQAITADHDDFILGSNDWSWDFWVRGCNPEAPEGVGFPYRFIYQYKDVNNYFEITYLHGYMTFTPKIYCKQVEGGVVIWDFYTEGYDLTGTWEHVVVGRHGNTPLIFINGTQASVTESTTISGKTGGNIAGSVIIDTWSGFSTNGIDEVRFVNGECAYTSAFETPQQQYFGFDRYRFTGRIDSIEKVGDVTNPQVLITAYDGLKELQNNTITTAILSGSTAAKTGTQIAYMTTSAEWPAIYGTSSIDAGNGIIPYCWANEKTAFQTIKDIADAEAGLFCAKADGKFYFRPREATTSVITLDQSVMLKDILLTSPYKLNRNVAKVYVYDKSMPEATAVKLWRMNDVPLVSTAAGLTVWGRYKYSGDECLGYDMVAPADTTDFKMNTKADGTGIDRTSKWNVTTTYFAEASKNVISSDGAVNNHYCTLLKNRGKPIVSNESTYKVYDKAGTAATRTLTIDTPFIQTSWQADFYDSFMTQLVATTLRFPIFQMESQPASQFSFDLFDKITVTIPKYSISGDYLVGGIEEEWLTDNGQAVLTTVYTEPDIIVTPPATLVGE